ncbi:hypothetical protein [Pseudolactococcus raffinolactis]|uniref:hypothetical protein n=1 Tax=Pseudolactococcus raffinolactis TaxID=1366 RepID=UPI00110A0312|nr:hypothetical protein [Lactococcus raffinolactis]TLQ15695.1 hypothetical protein FEZ46_02390 [Lactococcus raffinolactis]
MSFKINCICNICESIPENTQISFAIGYVENLESEVKMKCSNGHVFTALLQVPKFAFMFENGLTAFNKGFYIEAFSCFYSAIELFRIDFSSAYFHSYESKSVNELKKHFKSIKISERIYGIYKLALGLYSGDSADKEFTTIKIKGNKNKNITELRNLVVHAGHIPSKNEVEQVGYSIYKYIIKIYQTFNIKEHDADDPFPWPAIMQYYFDSIVEYCQENILDYQDISQNKDSRYTIIASDTYTGLKLNTVLEISNLPTFKDLLEINKGHNINKDVTEKIVNKEIAI